MVPQRQRRRDGRRDVVAHEGIPRYGDHARRLAPGWPVQRVGWVRGRCGDLDDLLDKVAVVIAVAISVASDWSVLWGCVLVG